MTVLKLGPIIPTQSLLVLRMIKDNLSDTNKLYLILQAVDSLLLENCKIRQTAGSFYRVKKEEQGREK